MEKHGVRRRISALTTVLGLGIALPFAAGVTPAQAQSPLSVTKSHEGNFARGGQGVYTITLTNTGGGGETGAVDLTDNLPTGLTAASLGGSLALFCEITNGGTTVHCGVGFLSDSQTITVTVNIADNAPCTVTNTVTGTVDTHEGPVPFSASDPTTITGGDCNGGGGGSILPINLNGVIPMFNNITTNNNINSPGASNSSRQNFELDAP
ncbi:MULTISPECIES: hypothetical protein [unclassified Streptomyces]|uniref:DUF7933 domain-containing protein n=1 Tax=unclassified Streptomyces TaxID=2593676 RepID=UPI0036E187D9